MPDSLPPEIIHQIISYLDDAADFDSARLVCKAFAAQVPSARYQLETMHLKRWSPQSFWEDNLHKVAKQFHFVPLLYAERGTFVLKKCHSRYKNKNDIEFLFKYWPVQKKITWYIFSGTAYDRPFELSYCFSDNCSPLWWQQFTFWCHDFVSFSQELPTESFWTSRGCVWDRI